MVGGNISIVGARLLGVVHKVTARTVRAKANTVECAAQFGLVLWMALQVAQLLNAVRKLALVAVLALASLLKGSAKLCLVSERNREIAI